MSRAGQRWLWFEWNETLMAKGKSSWIEATGGERNAPSREICEMGEGIIPRKIGKLDKVGRHHEEEHHMVRALGHGLIFIIRATYNVLPSPMNLNNGLGEDPACPLCSVPATLKNVLVEYKTSVVQSWYTTKYWTAWQLILSIQD